VLARARPDVPGDATQPDQIAHGFVIGVGNPDRRHLSGSMKTGQHGGVATIGLHPIPGLHRNQRQRHHIATMKQARKLAINAITAGAGLIAKGQRPTGTPAQLADGLGIIGYLAMVFPPSERPLSATATEIRSL